MAVRRAYRQFGLGKYMLTGLVQNEHIMGSFDAIVTASDPDAVEFYEKYAFLADPILNSKYSHIGDLWTNTTKMCYLPPYSSSSKRNSLLVKEETNKQRERKEEEDEDTAYINELTLIEKDFKRWQKIMFSSYQTQAQIFYKFKSEILTLKAKLCAKRSLIEDLKMRNDMLERQNRFLRMQLAQVDVDDRESADVVKFVDEEDEAYRKEIEQALLASSM